MQSTTQKSSVSSIVGSFPWEAFAFYSKSMWFPNSKACHHVTYDPANLARSQSYNRVDNLLIGNGKGLSIYNVGYNSLIQL